MKNIWYGLEEHLVREKKHLVRIKRTFGTDFFSAAAGRKEQHRHEKEHLVREKEHSLTDVLFRV